jgi:carboxyl-terminal processing protease
MKKKRSIVVSIIMSACLALGFSAYESIYYEINKNIDIFGNVYKEIVTNYVDEVDPEKFMHAGIDGMLETLDPYTVYLAGDDEDEIDLLTHGQYGGVGISIGFRDGAVTVLSPMEGYSAAKQGIKAGDRIVEIDGVPVIGMNADSVRLLVRGEPGTIVTMTVEREGEAKPIEFSLVREEIQVNNVSYSGYVRDGIGYIRLDRFSRRAGEEVRDAIREMMVKGALHGIILDLRGNPGGLLDAAVEIVSQFAPSGSTIVTTRGRTGADEKVYAAEGDPSAGTVPLVVLIDNGSASASEIVAGAVQDLDRGVIMGTRSFGKGLVQTVVPLGYNASMKVTTARYYTPSGRCIQEIDYLHRNKDGVFATIPDSLRREFKTAHGRTVKELGGITPDTVVAGDVRSEYDMELLRKAMFFNFVTTYVAKHPNGKEPVTVTDGMLQEFREYLAAQKFSFVDPTEKKIDEIGATLRSEKYGTPVIGIVDSLRAAIATANRNIFSRHTKELQEELEEELTARYAGEKGRIAASLRHDGQVQAAAGLLSHADRYRKILAANK